MGDKTLASTSMAMPIPEPFSFQANEWCNWLKRFQRFRSVSELDKKSEELQVNTLLYTIGPKAEDLLESLHLDDGEEKKYNVVVDKISNFFVPKTNVIFERARFNMRKQELGESCEQFVSALHALASKCNYGTLSNELIRDRLVVGIIDSKLSKNLQLDDRLTLEIAITKIMQSELVTNQQSVVRQETHDAHSSNQAVGFIGNKSYKKPQQPQQHAKQAYRKNNKHASAQQQTCNNCARPQHGKGVTCPAKGQLCFKCQKSNHFASCCRANSWTTAGQPKSQFNNKVSGIFLGNVQLGRVESTDSCDPWFTDIKVASSVDISFQLDSGADITCISEAQFSEKFGTLEVVKSKVSGPTGDKLSMLGKVNVSLSYNGKTLNTDVYVIKGLSRALLGRPVLEPLGVLKRIQAIKNENSQWMDRYPQLFSGLGTMPGDYKISVVEGAEPFSVSVPRRVALPLLPKVKTQLEKMVSEGIIKPVTEPTDWCAPMVVVPKKDGSVRITTDFSMLNRYVRREKYEMPSIEDTLASFGNSKWYSKLDAMSGFFQINLDKESSHFTSFITPYGRYRYLKLPMGITSAPEVFSRKMTTILEGLPGVKSVLDDICVYGSTKKEHDVRLQACLQRLVQNGVTLNPAKCEFGVSSLTYLGYIVGVDGIKPDPKKVEAVVRYPAPKTVHEVRRFLGLVTQLARFVPNLSEITCPIRLLLGKDAAWVWGSEQQAAFETLKKLLTSAPVLAHYSRKNETIVMADSSSHGLGAVLVQYVEGLW